MEKRIDKESPLCDGGSVVMMIARIMAWMMAFIQTGMPISQKKKSLVLRKKVKISIRQKVTILNYDPVTAAIPLVGHSTR